MKFNITKVGAVTVESVVVVCRTKACVVLAINTEQARVRMRNRAYVGNCDLVVALSTPRSLDTTEVKFPGLGEHTVVSATPDRFGLWLTLVDWRHFPRTCAKGEA